MTNRINTTKTFLTGLLLISSFYCSAQDYGRLGLGFQRAMWSLWGPSVSYDLNRHLGFETVVGIVPFPKTNSDIGFFERAIIRPLTYKTNSLYIAPLIGTARWEYSLSDGTYFYHGKEWSFQYGIMGGVEIDLRVLFPKLFPLYINAEFGYEGWKTKMTTDDAYISYGFGAHYRF